MLKWSPRENQRTARPLDFAVGATALFVLRSSPLLFLFLSLFLLLSFSCLRCFCFSSAQSTAKSAQTKLIRERERERISRCCRSKKQRNAHKPNLNAAAPNLTQRSLARARVALLHSLSIFLSMHFTLHTKTKPNAKQRNERARRSSCCSSSFVA